MASDQDDDFDGVNFGDFTSLTDIDLGGVGVGNTTGTSRRSPLPGPSGVGV